jgi:drug/metabolite transporter (DMT)-like permease
LLNNVVYLGLTFSALLLISPALVIIIVSCAPFMTTLVAAMLRQERLISMKLLGITVGFCGVLVISLQQPIGSATVIGIALAAFGTLAFSIGTILYRWRAADFDPIQVNLWQSVTGAIIMVAIGLWFGRMPDTVDSNLALAVLYLAIVVTIGGMSIWMFLIRVSGPSSASSYHLLNPFFAVLLSHFAFGTAVTGFDVGGVILICIGLLLVTKTVAKEQA